jgi:hypothetical protein
LSVYIKHTILGEPGGRLVNAAGHNRKKLLYAYLKYSVYIFYYRNNGSCCDEKQSNRGGQPLTGKGREGARAFEDSGLARDAVLFHQGLEITALQTDHAGRAAYVPIIFFECLQQKALFDRRRCAGADLFLE